MPKGPRPLNVAQTHNIHDIRMHGTDNMSAQLDVSSQLPNYKLVPRGVHVYTGILLMFIWEN